MPIGPGPSLSRPSTVASQASARTLSRSSADAQYHPCDDPVHRMMRRCWSTPPHRDVVAHSTFRAPGHEVVGDTHQSSARTRPGHPVHVIDALQAGIFRVLVVMRLASVLPGVATRTALSVNGRSCRATRRRPRSAPAGIFSTHERQPQTRPDLTATACWSDTQYEPDHQRRRALQGDRPVASTTVPSGRRTRSRAM
jgi:hypothetical protein